MDQSNNDYYRIAQMTLIPIITSIFATTLQVIIGDIWKGIKNFFVFIASSVNIMNTKIDDCNSIYIEMINDRESNYALAERYTVMKDALPIVWYINNKIGTTKCINKVLLLQNKNQTMLGGIYGGVNKTTSESSTPMYHFVPFNNDDIGKKKDSETVSDVAKSDKKSDASPTKNKKSNIMEIEKDIYLSIERDSDVKDKIYRVYICIHSKKKTLLELKNFYFRVKSEYDKTVGTKTPLLLTYKKSDDNGTMVFDSDSIDNTQSFDHIFSHTNNKIMSDLDKFDDVKFYEKYGLKRKLCYLLAGKPGSGKTCVVSAIAKYKNRSIVYIPISRIKNNSELYNILYKRVYNNVYYNIDEVVFLFDEIDSIIDKKVLKKGLDQNSSKTDVSINVNACYDVPPKKKKDDFNNDEINIGMILNMLDGNNNQDGMIIVATANNIEMLDDALYRNGRMELIHLEYMDRINITKMIEKYIGIKLSKEHIKRINDSKTIQSLTIKQVCLKYLKTPKEKINVDHLINDINNLYK